MNVEVAQLTEREIRRFERHIDRSGDCHIWTGTDRNKHGYGNFDLYRNGRRRTHRFLAHRVAFMLAHDGLWPTGSVVRHTCDNPPCVNPAHLLLGTQADNVRDAVLRGRVNTSALFVEVEKTCRECGDTFTALPRRRYCDQHRMTDAERCRRWRQRGLTPKERASLQRGAA